MDAKSAKQRAFNKAARQVIKQGGPSVNGDGSCRYRGPNGKRCHLGALIPDKLYDEDFEGDGSDQLPERILRAILPGVRGRRNFLSGLQWSHDAASHYGGKRFFSEWREQMVLFANDQGLNPKIVIGAKPA